MHNGLLKIFFLFVLILNLDVSAQEVELDLIGNWNLTDFWSNESKTIFTKDGYISMTINGEKIDGKNFIIRGGPNDGEKGEMKYTINTKISPIQIDIIALKDNIEKGRILGIIIPVNHTKMLMVLSFDGKRPEAINDENFEQTLTLYKTE
ncbi:hypothetical protein [Chryseobacterium sp. JUb7]|uniref:hypothetical protein n=1 Tax=Chryseobacterium sp. JUb7 TaxID=2940599 RepID=UPI00216950D5|nr:hypothetical protein [Chryseobacterium sp. JUb7]MCS3531597.1 hypothetical protein [Chryseobacterium sp. JUb7]